MKNFPNLPDNDRCCGCAACIDTCKHHALSLQEDKNGYYCIALDKDKCVGCKLCELHCHILNNTNVKRSDPRHVRPLAGWSFDEVLIQNSATGGIFAQVAHDMLEEGNTVVYGAALQEDSTVTHIEVTDVKDLCKLQNSKYQQSKSTGIYKKTEKRLKEGFRVLFSGTPCQIAALQAYLGSNTAIQEKLFTIEVICHGVPSNVLHRAGLKIHHAEKILAYRNKVEGKGWLRGNNKLSYLMPDGTATIMKSRTKDFVFRSYLTFSFSRKGCYTCPYAAMQRVSDMTLGDFWGFKNSPRAKEYENLMGTSIILPNTEKGQQMLSSSKNLHLITADWKDFLPYNQNLYMPTNKYIFIGSDYIHLIQNLPLSFQKVIMQNGFSGRVKNAVYTRLFKFFSNWSVRKKNRVIDEECRKALELVKK